MGAITRAPLVADQNALDETKTYLRIDGDEEDTALAALIAAAMEQCEAFTGRMTLRRAMGETLVPAAAWQFLTPAPVRAVTSVVSLAIDGSTAPVSGSDYELDIDADGRARVRFLRPVTQGRAIIGLEAGAAAGWTSLSDSVRHGIIRLVAHYHAHRDRADELGPPTAVAALWRGERQVRL